MISTILQQLSQKRILIAGFGREGKSSLAFLKKHLPDAYIGIADKNPESIAHVDVGACKLHFGNDYLSAMFDYDIVLKTPGISLLGFDYKNTVISSQTDLFLQAFNNQVIGVTGTKGKSTTSTLIHHLLKSAGRDTILAGNIGVPIFDIIDNMTPDTLVVYELSAHQLEFIKCSPHIAVLLNVFEEHLDHFGTFERYKYAKLNIIRYLKQNDWAVINEKFVSDALENFVNNVVYSYHDLNVMWDSLPLKGEHNQLNMKAAVCACELCGLSQDELLPALTTFKPLEHRLEKVGRFDGVTFYNDSISTIPQAAIAAVETLKRVDFLLLGGFDRGIDYSPLIEYLLKNPIAHLLYTGCAGQRITQQLKAENYEADMFFFADLEHAFSYIADNATDGDICLLSPAAASYDQYKNFEERGAKFKSLAMRFVKAD